MKDVSVSNALKSLLKESNAKVELIKLYSSFSLQYFNHDNLDFILVYFITRSIIWILSALLEVLSV